MFAFALWDTTRRVRLHLARDRIGEKPLYYGWVGDTFVFGSELKALRAHPHWSNEIDRGALALFMRHNYMPAPYSIYRGIFEAAARTLCLTLPWQSREPMYQAVLVCARSRRTRLRKSARRIAEEELSDELEALLRDAVRKQMVADVPLGAFLSGGIDSSIVVALMQAQSTRPVKTFTIGFQEARYNEAAHAAAIARHLGTEHTELYVTPQRGDGCDSERCRRSTTSRSPTPRRFRRTWWRSSARSAGDGGVVRRRR